MRGNSPEPTPGQAPDGRSCASEEGGPFPQHESNAESPESPLPGRQAKRSPHHKKACVFIEKNAVGTIIQLKIPWFQTNHRGIPASRKLCMYV